MRIKTSGNFFERKSNIRIPNFKQFLIFEGHSTEKRYFEFLIKYYSINNATFLFRDKVKEGHSNPVKIIEMLKELIEGNEKIEFTYDTILDTLFEYFKSISNNDSLSKNEFKKSYLASLQKINIDKHSPIIFETLSDITTSLISKYTSNISLDELLNNLQSFIEEESTFSIDIDKVYLIIDRDKKSFTRSQYFSVYRKANELGVDIYITNPCFEFWLLLHHTDCRNYSIDKLINNDYVKNNDTFVVSELKKYDTHYKKCHYDPKIYIDNVKIAILNAKHFESDINNLEYSVGTNLPELLIKLCKMKLD